jgi:protein-tyrosine phosphatase
VFNRIVVICDGNICRSPTAAALLQQGAPERQISSAGLVALVGRDMDAMARNIAEENGVMCPAHHARQIDDAIASHADLLLVMEMRQRNEMMQRFPAASGKIFLLGHWSGGEDIPDPYRRDRETFEHVYRLLERGSREWLARL